MKTSKLIPLFTLLFLSSTIAVAADLSMSDLLNKVKAGRTADSAENKKREQQFINQKQQQEQLIRDTKAQIASLEAQAASMEVSFNENELIVEEKRKQRDDRLGSLKELFGHLTSSSADLRVRFEHSITSTQYADRIEFLNRLIKKILT